jgi:hypothetical protein
MSYLFHAEGIDGAVSGIDQPQVSSLLHECLVDRHAALSWHMQLPAQFTCVTVTIFSTYSFLCNRPDPLGSLNELNLKPLKQSI